MSAATYDEIALPDLALPLQQLDVKGKGVMGVYSICAFTGDTTRVLALLQSATADTDAEVELQAVADGQHSPLCLSPMTWPALESPAVSGLARRAWSPPLESPGRSDRASRGPLTGRSDGRHSLEFPIRSRRPSAQYDGSGAFRRSFSEAGSSSPPPSSAPFAVPWAVLLSRPVELLTAPLAGARGAAVWLLFLALVAAFKLLNTLAQCAPTLLRLAALLAASHAAVALPAFLRLRATGPPRETAGAVMTRLQTALARAGGEADILCAGCDAAMALLPGTLACAMGVFSDGADGAVVSWLECGGEAAARCALREALPAGVSNQQDSGRSSVARACAADADSDPIDSRLLPGGLSACTDWADARGGGLNSEHAVTLKLSAGLVTVGFMTLHFGVQPGDTDDAAVAAMLLELSEAISGAVFVRRAFAINRATAPARSSLDAEERQHHSPRHSRSGTDDTEVAATASMEDDEAMLEALDASAAADAAMLHTWDLDAWALSDAEVAHLMIAMLHSVGLLRRFNLRPSALVTFVECVAAGYNDNPFHCWRHAFMVQHACWLFLADPAVHGLLEDLDCLALLLSAICHDLEHPGLTNAYQVNTSSELALRYNDTSVLEHHHTAVAFATIERAGILAHFKESEYKKLRKLIVSAILVRLLWSAKTNVAPLSESLFRLLRVRQRT